MNPTSSQETAPDESAETHLLFVDDSGTKEYSPSGQYGAGNTRHFLFGGPFLTVEAAKKLSAKIRALKAEAFGTDKVEIKSNWLRLENERKARYLQRFDRSETDLKRFVESFYEHLRDLRFVDSKQSELLQVADVIAYNVFRQFRQYGEEWETLGLPDLPAWFMKLADKFRRGPNGRIQGFGVGKIPLRTRVPWRT